MAQITALCPNKKKLIVKIEISYSSLVLCNLRIKVGPTAHPVGAAIEAKNIGFGTILSLLRSIGFLQEAEKLLPPLPMLPSQVKKMNEKKERVRHER
nr:hypothetical protein [uncultured Prevotella sp.]